MELSSILCRAQEGVQRDRAAHASLENVRIVATKAAIAWGLEAVAAEHREARHARRAKAALDDLQARRSHDEREATFSENPDRGFASIEPMAWEAAQSELASFPVRPCGESLSPAAPG